jgi:hypothetical protein
MIATFPIGGVVWDYGQYALGLEQLGYDVYYLEDTSGPTYDPRLRTIVDDPQYAVAYLEASLRRLSAPLGDRWHFRSATGRTYGIDAGAFREIIAGAELFVNVSGGTLLRDEYMACRHKVMIDTDPGHNHFWNYPRQDLDPQLRQYGFRGHDHFFTYAERIGREDCVLPTFGLDWQPTRPPVVLERWHAEPPARRWTTVLTWNRKAPALEYRGVRYGRKEVEFRRIETLPRHVDVELEIAAGDTDCAADDAGVRRPEARQWEDLGWRVVDGHDVSATAGDYLHYVQRSRGEFSVAKNVYVDTRSGWFSCRSVCYLAASRPVVVQDTGFSDVIPCGEGVLAFASLADAAAAIAAVERDYARHQAAARDIAARYFAADLVLGDVLRRIGLRD